MRVFQHIETQAQVTSLIHYCLNKKNKILEVNFDFNDKYRWMPIHWGVLVAHQEINQICEVLQDQINKLGHNSCQSWLMEEYGCVLKINLKFIKLALSLIGMTQFFALPFWLPINTWFMNQTSVSLRPFKNAWQSLMMLLMNWLLNPKSTVEYILSQMLLRDGSNCLHIDSYQKFSRKFKVILQLFPLEPITRNCIQEITRNGKYKLS